MRHAGAQAAQCREAFALAQGDFLLQIGQFQVPQFLVFPDHRNLAMKKTAYHRQALEIEFAEGLPTLAEEDQCLGLAVFDQRVDRNLCEIAPGEKIRQFRQGLGQHVMIQDPRLALAPERHFVIAELVRAAAQNLGLATMPVDDDRDRLRIAGMIGVTVEAYVAPGVHVRYVFEALCQELPDGLDIAGRVDFTGQFEQRLVARDLGQQLLWIGLVIDHRHRPCRRCRRRRDGRVADNLFPSGRKP